MQRSILLCPLPGCVSLYPIDLIFQGAISDFSLCLICMKPLLLRHHLRPFLSLCNPFSRPMIVDSRQMSFYLMRDVLCALCSPQPPQFVSLCGPFG